MGDAYAYLRYLCNGLHTVNFLCSTDPFEWRYMQRAATYPATMHYTYQFTTDSSGVNQQCRVAHRLGQVGDLDLLRSSRANASE